MVATEGTVASTGGMEVEEEDMVVLGNGDKLQGMTVLEKPQLTMTYNMNQHAIIALLYTSTTTTITSRCDYVCMYQTSLL